MSSHRVKARVGLAIAIIFMIVCIATVVAGTFWRGDLRAALPGTVAPDFVLRDEANHPVALSDLRGNVVVVYFNPRDDRSKSTNRSASTQPIAATSDTAVQPGLGQLSSTLMGSGSEVSAGTNADVSQLSALCAELSGRPSVKVLALNESPTTSASSTISLTDPMIAQNSVRTLVDPTGDVAREYRVDRANNSPTFFVIDGNGVIFYRGSLNNGSDLVDKILPPPPPNSSLLSPATQPSSCKKAVDMLLRSQGTLPVAAHAGYPNP